MPSVARTPPSAPNLFSFFFRTPPGRVATFVCALPELPVAERRALLADSLLHTVRGIHAVTRAEEWGDVALFTVTHDGITEGLVGCAEPRCMPGFNAATAADGQYDFHMTAPHVGYVMELTLASGRGKAAVLFRIVGRRKKGTSIYVLSSGILPIHALQWRNGTYAPTICGHAQSHASSLTDILGVKLNERTGLFMRDMLKVSMLINYFGCVSIPEPGTYRFISRTSKAEITLKAQYNDGECVITTKTPRIWFLRDTRTHCIHSIQELMEWAERQP